MEIPIFEKPKVAYDNTVTYIFGLSNYKVYKERTLRPSTEHDTSSGGYNC